MAISGTGHQAFGLKGREDESESSRKQGNGKELLGLWVAWAFQRTGFGRI